MVVQDGAKISRWKRSKRSACGPGMYQRTNALRTTLPCSLSA